jgi:DNA-binding response OmpR family regulator
MPLQHIDGHRPNTTNPPKSAAYEGQEIAGELAGRRVLIVEDEFFLAILLEEDLQAAGCAIVGPFKTVKTAVDASRKEAFHVAVLDINLNGQMVYPLAEELSTRQIPFLFLSGYGFGDLPDRFRNVPRLAKPYETTMLVRELQRLLARRSDPASGGT